MKLLLSLAFLFASSCAPAELAPAPQPRDEPMIATKTFETGFESVADFAGFYIVPPNHFGTATHERSAERAHSGTYAHKGSAFGANPVTDGVNTNHRAYPTVQLYKSTLGVFRRHVRVHLWVWLDTQLGKTAHADWFSFATLTSYADDYWFRSLLVNLHRDGYLHFMHTVKAGAPSDLTQETTRFPLREWVEIRIDLFYPEQEDGLGYAELRQNGERVSATHFYPRFPLSELLAIQRPACLDGWDETTVKDAERRCGLRYEHGLAQAHFGLYAAPLLTQATIFNDDLRIDEFAEIE